MRYQRVADEQALLEGLGQPGAAVVCGGTDLMIRMRAGMIQPEVLLDVSRVESMRGIRHEGSTLEIGASTTESELVRSPIVAENTPLLQTVLQQLGSVQIRNRGTLGGNIVNASPAADSAVPLLLYDGEANIVGSEGDRWVRLEEFFVGPGRTALRPGEFVRSLRLHLPESVMRSFYHKVGKRNALTIAIASLGALARMQENGLEEIRIAVGSVAPTPVRLRDLESWLAGRPLDSATIDGARQRAIEAISPISDVRATADYRRNVIGDLLARALRDLAS